METIKTEEQKQPVMQRSGEIITEIFENDLSLTGTEISFEINFAVLKFKHTIKKGKSKFLKRLKQKVEGNIKWSLKIIRAFRNMKPLLNLNLSNTLNLQNSTKFGEYNH